MLLALAEKLIRYGEKVLYVTNDWTSAHNCFIRAAESVETLPGYRCFRTNGAERITHESGGELKFRSVSAKPLFERVDTLLLDDVYGDYDHVYPASRVVRTSL